MWSRSVVQDCSSLGNSILTADMLCVKRGQGVAGGRGVMMVADAQTGFGCLVCGGQKCNLQFGITYTLSVISRFH